MKRSTADIEVIQPAVFDKGVEAFFTLKNEAYHSESCNIKGFNFGYNTDEHAEVVAANRKELFHQIGFDEKWTAFANQVHSNRVKTVTGGGTFANTDALITQIPGLALAIQVADCAALLMHDAASNMIAAVHAGWRGAAGNIVPHTLDQMQQTGADLTAIKAFISPSICENHFEVGPEVAEQFPAEFVDDERYKKPHIDLKGFLKSQLLNAGIPETQVEVHPGCTVEDKTQFYSYRREKKQSGRMLAVIRLKNIVLRNEIERFV